MSIQQIYDPKLYWDEKVRHAGSDWVISLRNHRLDLLWIRYRYIIHHHPTAIIEILQSVCTSGVWLVGVEDRDKLEVHLWKSKGKSVEVLEEKGDVEYKRDRVLSLVKISSDSERGMAQLRSETIPKVMSLSQNYPNPFNPTTTIDFQVSKDSDVKLLIYDIGGGVVKKLVSGKYSAGAYRIEWDGRNEEGLQVASGIYVYRMIAETYIHTRKMIFTK